ncbi:MAG: hypothetical protein RL497_242 [Pseudomonadota bacterium]|jgi:hypothetical protein
MKPSLVALLAGCLCVLSVLLLGMWRQNLQLQANSEMLTEQLTRKGTEAKSAEQSWQNQLQKAAELLADVKSENANLQIQLMQFVGAEKSPVIIGTQALLERIEDNHLSAIVTQKYHHFFSGLSRAAGEKEQLKRLLLDRERVLNAATSGYFSDSLDVGTKVAHQQAMVADVDAQIALILDDKEFGEFELFKDSGFEQYQVTQMARILGPDSALSEDQQRQFLVSKLHQKQNFTNWLEKHTGPELSAAALTEALEAYKNGYLQEVRATMNEKQFRLIQDYEKVQFEQMNRSLRISTGIEP